MYNFFDIHQAIKYLYPNLRLKCLLLKHIIKIKQKEDMSIVGKTSLQKGFWLKDLSILGLKIFFLLKKNVTEHQQFH